MSKHLIAGEGKLEGERAWAACNWLLPYYGEERIPYSLAIDAQSMLNNALMSVVSAYLRQMRIFCSIPLRERSMHGPRSSKKNEWRGLKSEVAFS